MAKPDPEPTAALRPCPKFGVGVGGSGRSNPEDDASAMAVAPAGLDEHAVELAAIDTVPSELPPPHTLP